MDVKRHASAESIRRIIEAIIAAVGVTNLGVLRDSDCPCFNKHVAIYSHHTYSSWKMVPLYFVLDYLPYSLTLLGCIIIKT